LILAIGLVAIAGVNLLWTQRRLVAGQAVWVGRLRSLISLEIILAFAILLVVGGMTAISPARNEIARREAAAAVPPAPQAQPIHLSEEEDDLLIHFSVLPGWVGNSTFTVQIVTEDGEPVADASLIRMRFEHQTENLGESELQIIPETKMPDGVYFVEGANLSSAGDWQVRLTIQRPDEFDTVADFEFNVIAPPPPPPMPVVDSNPVLPYRRFVLLLAGIFAVIAGLFALVEQGFRLVHGPALLASLLVNIFKSEEGREPSPSPLLLARI
jgi:hypothetical protein